jgi:twitching motility protein PilT
MEDAASISMRELSQNLGRRPIAMDEDEKQSQPLIENSPGGSETLENAKSLDILLAQASELNASDIILVNGSPVTLRVNGALKALADGEIETAQIWALLQHLLSESQLKELNQRKCLDFCFVRGPSGRVRANLHFQRGTLAASLRLLPRETPTLRSLNLPQSLAALAERRQGLILLTGATGCGKTSTMTALINEINGSRHDHIITIEDPVEFQHTNQKSLVEQIELGTDTPSFAEAVRAVLRQDPDVILIGEMRDSETMAAALTAAETGHLVLTSLHTNDAAQAVSRILDIFPAGFQSQVRRQLSMALLAVIHQRLLPAINGIDRFPAVEILMATSGIRNLIRRGDDHQLRANIETGRNDGMQTMEQSLAELIRSGRISRETAFTYSSHPEDVRRHLGE